MEEIEILLVEDNPVDIELTLRAFKKNSIANAIKVVRDGEEAVNYIFSSGKNSNSKSKMPKLILLDLKLPKIGGIDVLSQIKGNPNTRMIPVVVLTSSQEERDIVEAYQLGANSYIVKPVDFEKFVSAVKDLGVYWLLLNQPPQTGT